MPELPEVETVRSGLAPVLEGHRLARVTVPKPDGADGMPDVIIPRKCVGELRKLLDEVEGTVEVSLSPTKIRFGLGSAVAVVLFLILLVFTLVYVRMIGKEGELA